MFVSLLMQQSSYSYFLSAAIDLTTTTWRTGSLSLTWTRGNAINQNIQWDLKSCKSNFLDIFGTFDVSLGNSPPTGPYLATIPAKVGGSTCTVQATLLNSPFNQPAVLSFPGKQFPGIFHYETSQTILAHTQISTHRQAHIHSYAKYLCTRMCIYVFALLLACVDLT